MLEPCLNFRNGSRQQSMGLKRWRTTPTLIAIFLLFSAHQAYATGAYFFDPETGDPLPGNNFSVMYQDNPVVSPGTYILSHTGFGRFSVGGEEYSLLGLGENFFSATAPFVPSISVTFNTPIVGLLDYNGEIVGSVERLNFVASIVEGSFMISSITSQFPATGVSILFDINPTFLRVQAPGGGLPDSDFGVGFHPTIPEPSAALVFSFGLLVVATRMRRRSF